MKATFEEKLNSEFHPNAPCSNCKYVAGAHGCISGICPNGQTFYEPVKAVANGR